MRGRVWIGVWLLAVVLAARSFAAERPAISVMTDGSAVTLKADTAVAHSWLRVDQGAGKYKLVLAVIENGKPILWAYDLVVAAPEPVPPGPVPPTPPDPVPPVPSKLWQVMFLVTAGDLEQLPAGQREALGSLTLRDAIAAKGHVFLGVYDPSQVDAKDGPPARWKEWFAAVKGDAMPRVAIGPKDGGAIRDFGLPADEAGILRLLERGGE